MNAKKAIEAMTRIDAALLIGEGITASDKQAVMDALHELRAIEMRWEDDNGTWLIEAIDDEGVEGT